MSTLNEAIKELRARGVDAQNERWHVAFWMTGKSRRTRRCGYFVKCESDRGFSGTPLGSFAFRSNAQRMAEEHNDDLTIRRLHA